MKTLPLLTLTLSLSLASGWAVISLRTSLAQETAKPVVGPANQPGADSKKAEKSGSDKGGEKPVTRRNEASGAVAIVTLEEARERLINYQSIQAKVLESVSIGDRQFRLSGSYLQGDGQKQLTEDGLKLRLEYQVSLGGTEGKLLEVCDGQLLWTLQTIGKEQRVTRRNVRQILQAALAAEATTETVLHAELGLGGLPGMLASIQKAVQFEKQWEQDYDGQAFVVIDGGWKSELRAKFVGPNASAEQPLPSFIPDRIRVYFDKAKLFPRRILYLKKNDAQKSLRPMVSIDFMDVETNKPVDEKAFVFKVPESVNLQDVTDEYLRLFQKNPTQKNAEADTKKP